MIKAFRKSRLLKIVSITMAVLFINEIIFPTVAMALTGGPSQPEVESFAPIEATDMVDLFSGDFKYNIPLMDVDGYPININYNSNITMDQEASWVGLGWNLNPGVINRSMRGLPDEFCGDEVKKEFKIETDETMGVSLGVGDVEIFGFSPISLSANLGIKKNNITGTDIDFSLSAALSLSDLATWNETKGLSKKAKDRKKKAPWEKASLNERISRVISKTQLYSSYAQNGIPILKDLELGRTMNGICRNPISSIRDGILNKVPTYTPQIQTSVINESSTYNGKVGGALIGIDGYLIINGYYSKHGVIPSPTIVKSYGYMNTEQGMANNGVSLLDFNRENDGPFTENLAYLPLTNYTYDSYSILGQGLTGSFRPYKGAVDVLFDQAKFNFGSSGYFGVEAAGGNLVKIGVDISTNNVYGVSGIWVDNNYALPILNKDYFKQTADFEKAYFKEAGEMNVENNITGSNDFYQKIGEDNPTKLQLADIGGGRLLNVLNYKSVTIPFNKSVQRESRAKRTTHISYLNTKEALVAGVNKNIENYKLFTASSNLNSSTDKKEIISRMNRRENHLSEITVTKTDGSRYVYGIPAYNNRQIESNFNVSPNGTSDLLKEKGMVKYSANDDSYGNSSGLDYYYNKTEMPAYPHSYLLTAVLSADYVDISGDGPTDDDLGNFVKFNYGKLKNDYKWRSPLSADPLMAAYSKGFDHTLTDDKASYTYGEKEVWYLQTIETKNQIAEFHLSDRKDGCGVKGTTGEIDKNVNDENYNPLKKLDKISLYSKYDRRLEETDNTHIATPIKEVHFEYTYNLCNGIPNSMNYVENPTPASIDRGKLTLKTIYFTYGNSKKGKFNAYKFDYHEINPLTNTLMPNNPENPDYDNKAYDRWGNYMPFNIINSSLNAVEWPYVNQNRNNNNEYYADKYVSVWSLKEITLPSGGKIKVDYESDDYAYVQDQRAMEMFKIVKVYTPDNSQLNQLYGNPDKLNELSIIFELKPECSNYDLSNPLIDLYKQTYKDYFENIYDLYFNCNIKIDNEENKWEQVSGYGRIKDKDFILNGNKFYGKITLNEVEVNYGKDAGEDMTNPITKAGLNFCVNNAPYIVSDDDYPGQPSGSLDFSTVISEVATVLSAFTDEDKLETMIDDENCKFINLDKSWIRLRNPGYNKKGGGSRVKKITITDGLKFNGIESEYGQEYSYQKQEVIDGKTRTISSGVASNEPGIGGDECALKLPIYKNWNAAYLLYEEKAYFEGPIGESFYPGASVGYSKVTVKSLTHAAHNKKHATGSVVHEFFTARDFPVTAKFTTLDVVPTYIESNKIVASTDISRITASMGYVVDCNDMHGKQKAVSYYAEDDIQPISGEKYIYQTKADNSKQLDNEVSFLNKNGEIKKGMLGMDIDFVTDFRSSFTSTSNSKVKENTETFLVFLPVPIPTVFGSYNYVERSFKSASVTKVISRKGVLKEVQKFDASSYVSSKNLVYDYETGEVLETQTNNEYDDPLYSFTYPAHFAYDKMDLAYKNTGIKFKFEIPAGSSDCIISVVSEDGSSVTVSDDDLKKYIISGDEVILSRKGVADKRAWVLDVDYINKKVSLIGYGGLPITSQGKYEGKIVRSGRKNTATTPIGTFTSLNNPIQNNELSVNENTHILNASATEFNNVRKVYSLPGVDPEEPLYNYTASPTFNNILYFINLLPHIGKDLNVPNNLSLTSPINASGFLLNALNSDLDFSPIKFESYKSGSDYFFKFTDNSTKIINFKVTIPSIQPYPFDNTLDKLVGITNLRISDAYSSNNINNMKFFVDAYYYDYSAAMFKSVSKCTCQVLPNNIPDEIEFLESILIVKDENIPYKYDTPICNDVGFPLNPFTYGIFGHWYPFKNYAFLSARKQSNLQTSITNVKNKNIRKDGYMENFFPFWVKDVNNVNTWIPVDNQVPNAKWVAKDMVTIVNREGAEVENKDILGIYSSAIYAFNCKLPTAVAKNARMNEFAYDGFEDYKVSDQGYLNQNVLDGLSLSKVTNVYAHTGKYSILINSGYEYKINAGINLINTVKTTEQILHPDPNNQPFVDKFIMQCADGLQKFSFFPGKKYILSFWMKDMGYNPSSNTNNLTISGVGVSISSPVIMKPIEGWQKVEAEIKDVTANTPTITINSSLSIYIDDIRIQPSNSSVKSYVYNDLNFKLMAELDENNYATFYEYDEEGALARLKKETAKGVFTIKEIKKSFKKQ